MAIHSFIKIFLINVFVGTFSLLQAQILISASVITPGDAGILSEKCSGPYKLVIRRDASNQDTTLIFISDLGVAQAGVDYNFPAGSFPVTLLPKDSMVMIPVLVVNDGLNEGLESLVWEIAYLAGTQSGAINVETAITDQYSVTINSPDTIVWCRDLNYILLATSDAEIHWLPSDNFIDSTGEAATVRPHESGWYYATVGSATCGAKDSVYFDLAIVDINEPDTVFICLGDEITLHGSIDGLAENFIWSPTDSLSNPNILNPVANPIVTTTYLLQSNIGVCTAFDRVVVRVDSIPKDLHINIAPQKDHYCQGEIVALFSASFDTLDFPDLVFDWSPYNQTFTSPKDVLNAALTLNDTTLYIRDNINNACMTKDSILIKVVPSGVPISVSDTTLCPGEKFNVRILSDQVHDPEWTPEDGLSCTKCLNPTVTVTGLPGSTVSYMFSGKILECPVGANLTIHIPGIQIINLAADQTVCTGDTTSVLILNPEGLSDFNWSVTNGDASLSCTSCIKPVVTVNSNNAITIVVNAMTSDHTQSCGAVGSINLNPGLEFHDNRPQIQACLGGTVVATTGNSNYTNIQWDVTGGQLSLSCSNCPTPTVTVNSNGMLRFFAESPDPDICKVIGSVPVGIFPEDESNLLITPDPNAGAGIGQGADVMATLSASPPPASVMWNINGVNLPTTTSTVTFNASNEINFVTATFINSKGCEQIDTLSFHTTPPNYKIPNAFTPDNGDDLNDNFRIIINGNIEVRDFMVFNRWGQLVYKAADNDLAGWDGRFKNEPAASDTYVYKATLRFPDGNSKIVKGDVILLR